MSWTLLHPILTALLYAWVFSTLWQHATLSLSYGLYVFLGVIVWNLFQYSVLQGGSALLQAQELIRKIPFPTPPTHSYQNRKQYRRLWHALCGSPRAYIHRVSL